MKWKNKGHEFDMYKEIFTKEKKVYIYGAGENGKLLYDYLGFDDCIEGFIDNNPEKTEYLGKKVINVGEFLDIDKDKYIVIMAVSNANLHMLMRQMIANGYVEGKNLFNGITFIELMVAVYAFYSWDKLIIPNLSFLMTTVCNLNCYGCLNFTNDNKNKRHYEFTYLKENIEALFEKIDYIPYLSVCGGEPLLYPHIEEFLEFLIKYYRDKIGILRITTNGTIIPKDSLCEILKEGNVLVVLDDYRENVPLAKEKYPKVYEILDEHGIAILDWGVNNWLKITRDTAETDLEKVISLCSACSIPFKSLKEKKIYGCNYVEFSVEAKINEEETSDYFALENLNNDNRSEFLEFIIGYSETGYYSFCKKCKGYLTVQRDEIPVAKQIDK